MNNSGENNRPTDENLRFAHESLHRDKLGHGQSIYNGFSLFMAGLLVLLGGIIGSGGLVQPLKITLSVALPIIFILICHFIWLQRGSVVKCTKSMRLIEEELKASKWLPDDYRKAPQTCGGITRADWIIVLAMFILIITIIICLWCISVPRPLIRP